MEAASDNVKRLGGKCASDVRSARGQHSGVVLLPGSRAAACKAGTDAAGSICQMPDVPDLLDKRLANPQLGQARVSLSHSWGEQTDEQLLTGDEEADRLRAELDRLKQPKP